MIKGICKQNDFANELSKYKNNLNISWNTLKTLIGTNNDKSWISDSIKIDNVLTNDSNKGANKLCGYFSEISNKFASKIPNPDKSFH